MIVRGGNAGKAGDLLRGDVVDGEGIPAAFLAEFKFPVHHAHTVGGIHEIAHSFLTADKFAGKIGQVAAHKHDASPFKKIQTMPNLGDSVSNGGAKRQRRPESQAIELNQSRQQVPGSVVFTATAFISIPYIIYNTIFLQKVDR